LDDTQSVKARNSFQGRPDVMVGDEHVSVSEALRPWSGGWICVQVRRAAQVFARGLRRSGRDPEVKHHDQMMDRTPRSRAVIASRLGSTLDIGERGWRRSQRRGERR